MTIYTDAATVSTKTSVQSTEITQYVQAASIRSVTSIQSIDAGPYYDSATIGSVTTPDVVLEFSTSIVATVSLSGNMYEGGTITASVTIDIIGGVTVGTGGGTITDPDVPGHTVDYSVSGDWGSSDDDNGLIP